MASQSSQLIPFVPPPPGAVPNLINPASRTYQIYAISSVFLALTLVFVAIRLYAKVVLQKRGAWDDYVCLASMGGIISYVALTFAEVQKGYGKHEWEISIKDLSDQIQMEVVFTTVTYNIAICLVKLTVLMLLNQIFGLLRWMKICIWIGAIVSSIWYLTAVILTFVLCAPSGGLNWLQIAQTARCARIRYYGIAQGVFNILSDFYLLIIPIPAVWSLQMPTRGKAGVCAIFMTGFLACIVTCVGLWARVRSLNLYDVTWTIINVWITIIVEMCVGLILTCMPACATVARHHGLPFRSFWTLIGSKIFFFSSKISNKSKSFMDKASSKKTLPFGSLGSDSPRGEEWIALSGKK